MTPKLKKIIFTLIALGVLFVLYAVFLKPDPTAETLVTGRSATTAVTSQEARLLGSQISQALLKIEQIALDRKIFDNPIFTSLEDRSRAIIDEPVGRTNPFAPLGDVSVNVSTRTNLDIVPPTQSSTTTSATATSTRTTTTTTATTTRSTPTPPISASI